MRKKLTMLLISLFLVQGTVWADALTPGQRYRLRNVMTGLYMQANGSSNLQLQEQKYSVLQFFSVEDAGDGKFYLKSESGANKYVNASGWNAVVGSGDDSKTPYTIALVNGETDVYTLDQTFSSYTGKIGADANTAGTSLYCNKGEGNNGKWQFEAVESPEVCTFDPAKTYRIKSEYSGLYMQLVNTGTSGLTEGAFQLKDKSIVAEGQKFMFEAADGEKYYLKTVKEGTTYYVNQGSWNFHAGAEATTPFTIAIVDGHTAVYSLHQTADEGNSNMHGYAGNSTTSATDGTKIYCNSPLAGNTIWSFEEVVADPNNITEQAQLTNDSYYKISGERGFIFGADDVVKGTNAVSQAYSEGNKDQHFAIISKNDKLYLYNVGAKKFVVKSGNNTKLVDLPEQPITLGKTSDNNYVWSIKLNGTNKLNLSTGYNDYGVYTDYNTEDPGNCWLIYKVGTFDPAEALAAFDKVYVTVNYVLGSRKTVTKVETVTKGETYSLSNPSTYTTVSSCTAGGDDLIASDGVYSFTVNEATTVTMNLEEDLPFTPSTDFENAAWHVMRIRPVRNGIEEFNWVTKGESEPYTFSSERPTTDVGMWAFVGDPIDGFKIYNKAAGSTMTLGVNGSNVVVKEGDKTWTVGKCIEGGTLRGFYLYEGSENKYVHEYDSKFQIWNNSAALTDGGSALVAEPAVVAESTNLYALKSPTETYLNFTPITTQGTTTQASFQDEPSFLYKIEENGSFAFQSFDDDDAYVGATDRWLVTKAKSLWNISAEDANGYVTISRSIDANARLGHDGNTNAGTGVFTNVGNTCFGWQLIPAYPVTIIYKNSNDEVLETVKAATIAGTEYSFTVDTKGGTLVSCVADKGTMTETDGTYSFATVNGATTVTVTLEEPEVLVVFNPTPGKAYALKVKDQELYLNIRTLGIDDPNNSGSNNISLSARPFAEVYFEAGSTEGTWKMKNVNGKYVGASGWNPVICDAPHDWTIVLENGVVTIAKAAGAFVNANDGQVAAGNPLYCDKGTPLQFELFDYDDVNFVTGTGTRNGDNGVGGQGTIQVKEIHEEGLNKIPLGAGWRLTMEVENPDGVSYNKFGSSILAVGSNAFPEKNGYKGFQLYLQSAANGGKLDAVFGGGDHIIDNVTYQGDFSLVVEYDGSSKITFTTVNAQGNEATNVLSGSLPEIDVFSYGLPTGINIKSAAIQVFDIMYTFHVGTTPEGEDITITYDGEAVEAGQIFYGNELDLLKFAATEIEGYTWAVVADKAANTLTLNYTQAEVADLQAVKDLVNRIGGEGTADKFMFVHNPWLNSKQETFVLGAQDGKIRIEGSTISAITTGIGWYLNNVAHINIAWNSLNEKTVAVKENGAAYADLSNLPLPSQTETHTSDAKYRYYLNTCTFGYSMTSWTWTRWQQEIDWMALHGINMPLQLVGLEEVWRTFLIKCGYSETDAKAFVAGPAFIAWWAMNNLQGWGGTDPGTKSGGTWAGAGGVQDDAWYARQTKLAKQIVEAQRGLGMQPVLPGWSGMVPTNFADKTGYTTRGNGGNWAGDFVRPLLLNVSNANYAEIAADYYECLHAVMGESQYYSMDPFHEGGGAGTMEDYQYMYAAMEAAKPGSQWVIQQWQWSATQKYSLTAVPEGRLIVLDLFSDGSPAFDGYNGYAPQEAVFCAIPNFGGRSGLMGRLQNVTDNYFKFKGKYASIKGIGTAPEAIEQTPVAYDLIYQLPWMNGVKPDVAEWVDNYAVARYGKDNAIVKEAWSLLRQGPLNYGADGIQGPVEDVWAARPNLNANAASYWGKTLNNGTASNTYTKERRQMLIDAVYKLIDQEDELALENGSVHKSNYLYDLVEFGGAVMADYAYDLLLGIQAAKNAAGANFATDATYIARRDAFLQLILDMDAFRGTNLNFRLGKWTQEARAAAAEVEGATTATPDWYEYNNARTILSTWSSPNTNLTDYSYRSWQGLLKDYYYPRWKHYFDNNCTGAEYGYFEWNWAHGMKHEVGQTAVSNVPLAPGEAGHTDSYTREPEGNTVEKAVEMLRKYIVPIHMNDGTIYYAYRTFTYDLTDKVTVNVAADATVDFTHYFDIPGDATITGDFINNEEKSAPVNAVPVKPEEAVYTATITLADGTKLENFTVHTPLFNGVYKVSLVTDWGNTPVFIQYNENDNVAGYKMVATSNGYSTDSELDKWFSIAHSGDGYTISAQGKYLKTPLVWEYVLFSENAEEAGTYLFDDSDTHDIYKIVNVDGYHLQAWSYVMALEPGNNTPSTFAFEKVEAYPITIPTDSFTTVYLPFNVLLPAGVEAYDVCGNELVNDSKDHAQGALEKIANSGDVLKAGTPAVLKGAPGSHALEIVMSSNKAKVGLPYSALRGSYEKHTLVHTEGIKKFVLHEKHFDDLQTYYKRVLESEEGEAVVEMPANTCWLETNIEADQIGLTEGSYVKIDDWLIMYENRPKGILLSSIAVSGEGGALVIPETYNINGEEKQIVAISEDFFENNTEITSVTLPATLSDVGASKLTFLEQITYHGFAESKMGEVGQFINTVMHTPISGDNTWRMTVAVKIDSDTIDFNEWGSAILATKEETLADYYDDGSMQLYLKNDHDSIIFKLDNADDRYTFCYSNPDGTTLVNDTFTFVLDNDGSGGYDAKVIFANGKEQVYAITASDKAELKLFRNIFSSMPEGMHVTVTFEDKVNDGLFVGCTNLREIIVADDSESFTSIDGVLYSKDGTHIIRFPEGATGEYDIDKKVTRLNPGSLHGVKADITFHSNPKILFVADHEEHMMARYYLSLEDVDKVDFESDNTNTFETVRYERAPLAEGKFGTFFLPFVPENIMDKYDFFELVGGDNTGLVFSQVEEVEANKPYLYTLKEDATNGNGNDVFTAGKTTIVSVGDSVHVAVGEWKAFGTYRNDYVLTSNYKDSYYYYLSASSGMFHRVTQRLDLRPFRAYFVWVPETTEGQTIQAAPKLALRFRNGSTTEISPEQVKGWEETPVYYDLMGRRVENPIDGVYIVNGKKVVIE